jgi:hypothetical protein
MATISSTTVQKTFKLETHTLFGRASIGVGGDVSSTITANGASKGLSFSRIGTGIYEATVDTGIPVQQFLGAPVVQVFINGNNNPNQIYNGRVFSEDATTGKVAFIFYDDAGDKTNLPSGSELQVTLFMTTSTVF